MFIIVLILNLSLSISQENKVPEDYYAVTNSYLKILKLSEGELIFYGGDNQLRKLDGAILRTYDNCKTFHQNYSGTKNFISKLIYEDKVVYGVTAGGEFISSKDKGDYWKIYQIDTVDLVGITYKDDLFYIISSDKIFYKSNDYGKTWSKYNLDLDNIKNISGIYNLNNQLMIYSLNEERIFISNNAGLNWYSINTPFVYNNVYVKDNELYISNENTIAKLNNDESWEIYNLENIFGYFNFIKNNNKLIISYKSKIEQRLHSMEVYELDLDKKVLTKIDTFVKPEFGFSTFFIQKFQSTDLVMSDDEIIFSNAYKTILKYNKNKNWEILSTYSPNISGRFILEKNYWFFQDYETGQNYKSTNGGITFNYVEPNVIIKNDDSIRTVLTNILFKDKDKAFVLNDMNGFNQNNHSKSHSGYFAYSNDGLNNINTLNIKFNEISIYQRELITIYENDYYFSNSRDIANDVPDSNGNVSGFIKELFIYKVNSDNFNLDTMYRFKDSLTFINLYFDEDKIWAYGTSSMGSYRPIIFLSEDKGKSFQKVLIGITDFSGFVNAFLKSKNGDYFLITYEKIYEIDITDFSIQEVNSNYNRFNVVSKDISQGYLEDKLINFINYKEGEQVIHNYGRFEINGDININESFKLFIPIYSLFDDTKLYVSNHGFRNILYKPIEEDRLKYYNSVENTEKRNYLYTFPPFPQPTKNEVKINTYWDSALPFTIEDIDIYNLAGVKINTTDKVRIIKETNYNGHIIWDTSNEEAGIYIVYIKHGTELRVCKILVK